MAGSLEQDYRGTHIVESGAFDDTAGLSPDLADDAARRRPASTSSPRSGSRQAEVDGVGDGPFFAFDAATIGELFDLGTVEGDLDALGADGIAVFADEAIDKGWHARLTRCTVTFPTGDTSRSWCEAIYDNGTEWVGSEFVDLDALRGQRRRRSSTPGSTSPRRRGGDRRSVAAAYPSAEVLDKDGFIDSVERARSTRCSD